MKSMFIHNQSIYTRVSNNIYLIYCIWYFRKKKNIENFIDNKYSQKLVYHILVVYWHVLLFRLILFYTSCYIKII